MNRPSGILPYTVIGAFLLVFRTPVVQGGFNSIDVFVKKGNTFVLHCHDNSPKSHVQAFLKAQTVTLALEKEDGSHPNHRKTIYKTYPKGWVNKHLDHEKYGVKHVNNSSFELHVKEAAFEDATTYRCLKEGSRGGTVMTLIHVFVFGNPLIDIDGPSFGAKQVSVRCVFFYSMPLAKSKDLNVSMCLNLEGKCMKKANRASPDLHMDISISYAMFPMEIGQGKEISCSMEVLGRYVANGTATVQEHTKDRAPPDIQKHSKINARDLSTQVSNLDRSEPVDEDLPEEKKEKAEMNAPFDADQNWNWTLPHIQQIVDYVINHTSGSQGIIIPPVSDRVAKATLIIVVLFITGTLVKYFLVDKYRRDRSPQASKQYEEDALVVDGRGEQT